MSDRATFTYTGPDQHIRIGGETLHRHIAVLTTDPQVIAEARKTADVVEETAGGNVKTVAEPAPEVEAAPPPAPAPKPAVKPKRAPKPKK